MSAVIQRRRVRLALLALAAVSATGCTTFTDDGAVARVGDEELSNDAFTDLTAALESTQSLDPLPEDRDRVDGELARAAVANWLALQLAAGEGVIDRYMNGIEDLGVACVFAFQTIDVTTGEALVAELEGGADWFDVVAREAPGTPAGGRQQCLPQQTLGEELSALIAGMNPDDPYRVIDGQPAIVVRAQDVSELFGIDLLTSLQSVDPDLVSEIIVSGEEADVYVDPRIGTFDALRLAVSPVN